MDPYRLVVRKISLDIGILFPLFKSTASRH